MQITYYLPTLVAMAHRQMQTENAFQVHIQWAQLERYLVASSCCVCIIKALSYQSVI